MFFFPNSKSNLLLIFKVNMSIVMIFVFLIMIAILVNFTRKTRSERFYKLLRQFPSHPTYPLIGNAHLLAGSTEGVLGKLEKLMQPYDRLVYWMGPIPVLMLKKCDDIATALNQSIDRDELGISQEALGIGLLNARCEEWKKSRRVLAPAFSSDMLLKYLQVFNKNARILVETLKSVAVKGEEVDVLDLITNANLDSIIENSMGISIRNGGKVEENFCNAILEGLKILVRRIQYPWLLSQHIFMMYLRLTRKIEIIEHVQFLPAKIIKDKMNNYQDIQSENNAIYNGIVDTSKAVIDLLIKKSAIETDFNETRIRDELLQIIAAGIETTALSVSFLMLMLAINQDIQQKVYEEITQLPMGSNGLSEDHLTNHLGYLEQCIKETLRMFSPVMVTARRIHKEIILQDNKIIPVGTFVATLIHLANYDADLYGNPQKFDPEHFNDQAVRKRSKNSQLSFGCGPRSCIGAKYAMMSIKTQIVHIMRNYHLSTSIKEITKDDLKTDLSIRSKLGYPIKFTSR